MSEFGDEYATTQNIAKKTQQQHSYVTSSYPGQRH